MNNRFLTFISGFINFIFAVIILGLLFRLGLRVFGANPGAGFVDFVYNATQPLLAPFANIFQPYTIQPGKVFEISTLLAIFVYLVIVFLITELLYYIDRNIYESRQQVVQTKYVQRQRPQR